MRFSYGAVYADIKDVFNKQTVVRSSNLIVMLSNTLGLLTHFHILFYIKGLLSPRIADDLIILQ